MQPYEEVTDVAYGEHVATTFKVDSPQPRTLILNGTCPRCAHPMEFMITDQVVKRWRWPPAEPTPAPAAEPADEPMMCTCEADHPHRPDDYVGCGAYWNIKVLPA
jgi:hypothetical protein